MQFDYSAMTKRAISPSPPADAARIALAISDTQRYLHFLRYVNVVTAAPPERNDARY
jgi:hypothetical protein